MKTKTKKTNKTKRVAPKKIIRVKKYESHYLALVLVGFLLLEGILISSTTNVDWQKGVAVLDVSTSFTQTVSDLALVLEPVTDTVSSVNQFYQLAATEMTSLLDISHQDPIAEIAVITGGIQEFYVQATNEMIVLLDFSSIDSWTGSVAGASISSY